MDKSTATGVISTIRNYGDYAAVKKGPFASYYAGHDDKHRSRDSAYTYYTSGSTCGFYQTYREVQELGGPVKQVLVIRVKDPNMPKGWGNQETVLVNQQDLILVKKYDQDIDKEGDAKIVYNVFILKESDQSYYKDPQGDASKFVLVCPICWTAWQGFTFEGTGKTKDKPDSCGHMALILAGSGTNIQLVTHYPISATSLGNLTALT